VTINLNIIMTNTERFFRFMGFYVSRSGVLHTKTLFAKFMANLSVTDGHFIYLGRNMYKLNKEE
jgi:hypothetical protein